MPFKPKVIVFDLDGTLAESKQRVSAEMGELISELATKMPVAVMSGAGFPQFEKQFLPALPMEAKLERLFLFPDNAAQCFVYKNNEWHPQYDHALSADEKTHITEELKKSLSEAHMTGIPMRVWGQQIQDRGAEIAFSPLGQEAPLDQKEEWHQKHDSERAELRNIVAKHLPDFAVVSGGLTTIDITRKGINKAYGIKRLVEMTGVSISEILYVGDALEEGGNDAVVKESGVRTHEVFGPGETAALIQEIIEAPVFSA